MFVYLFILGDNPPYAQESLLVVFRKQYMVLKIKSKSIQGKHLTSILCFYFKTFQKLNEMTLYLSRLFHYVQHKISGLCSYTSIKHLRNTANLIIKQHQTGAISV